MKTLLAAALVAASLLAAPLVHAQSIHIGPGGARLDPRTPREREIDAIRRKEQRGEFREERRDAIRDEIRREERRRGFDENGPPTRRAGVTETKHARFVNPAAVRSARSTAGQAMHQARSVTAADFESDCPVPLDLVARLLRTEADALPGLLDAVPEATRARLAVWLYGRSHTHEIGIRVAATCEGAALRRAAGLVGNALYDLSHRPYEASSHGNPRSTGRRISLGGSRAAA